MTDPYGFDTLQIHAGQSADPTTHAVAVPIYQTTAYQFDDTQYGADLFALSKPGNIYTRIMNPTTDVLEKRLSALEGGVGALTVASGMAAILYVVQNLAQSGDEIVALNTLYGGTYTLFSARLEKNYGIRVRFVDPENMDALQKAINDKTRAVYYESLGNPDMNIPDMQRIAGIAHAQGVPVVVDNTFATPYLIQLKDFGVDIVVHSLTKYIGGHGNSLGGAIVDLGTFDFNSPRFAQFTQPDAAYNGLVFASLGTGAFITRARVTLLRDTGAALSPFNAFMILQGLETLSLRMQRHTENAQKTAAFLQNHPMVDWVRYPALPGNPYYDRAQRYFPKGVGGIMAFGIKGGIAAGSVFQDHLRLFYRVSNVSDTRSLAVHPASTTHAQLSTDEMKKAGVTPEMIRLSIGLEDIKDILADLSQALDRAAQAIK